MSGEAIYAPSDAFGQFRVKEMSESDFALESATPIALKDPSCHILLFYEPSSTDPRMLNIWEKLARDIGGPVIGAVNTTARREVMAAFFRVKGDLDDPFNAFTSIKTPTIMVYRSRWPQAFYNGQLSYDAIRGWITTLACKPGYRELNAYDSTILIGPGNISYFPPQQEEQNEQEEDIDEVMVDENFGPDDSGYLEIEKKSIDYDSNRLQNDNLDPGFW
jgi:hypothetical protein